MTTVDDFGGRSCPYCGALNSLEADDARGEVACTECARVVAMGLEENTQTRFVKDAVFGDLNEDGSGPGTVSGSGTLSRSDAVAIAEGRQAGKGAQASKANKYSRALHGQERVRQRLETLCDLIRRGDPVKEEALEILSVFVGRRKERNEKLDKMNESIAACVMLAAARCRTPLPLPELRTLDPSLGDVDLRRKDVVREVQLAEEEKQNRANYAKDLVKHYIRLLQMQMSKYEEPCLTLLEVLRTAAREQTGVCAPLSKLSEDGLCVAAVLLARTQSSFQWSGKPTYDKTSEPPTEVFYQSFAALSHLSATFVTKIMATVKPAVEVLVSRFNEARQQKAEKVAKKEGDAPTTLKRERQED
ncbi:transcription factor IIB [Angomonas deanei]|uniref:Transcription factor IIB C-terminal module 1, putative n=1 Tax=Angomonas deanei TaxID=59799 RepID=A0A7G2CUK4_9TRYP|nr:transcription factor IIB [Angomonas deanei]CAD2221942.1 Transcription factor IIB C-terminal module 1, putative [Angomonas deanei]|eukprot:EPY25082.1 transcription factor IIB [Angomonas deanei]